MFHGRWALKVVIKRKFFYIDICSFSTTYYAICISYTSLRSSKSISIPNFNELSPSIGEIKLLPVSENGRSPYWNSTSGSDFDVCVGIGISFFISLPNFVVIGGFAAEL